MKKKANANVRWMAEKARSDAFFLGKLLAEYQESNGLDDRDLATELQCDPEALCRLALCQHPDDHSASFAQDVRAIAAFASCNASALMQVLGQAAAMRALREQGSGSAGGLLMAARDRYDDEQRERPQLPPTLKRRRSRNDK